MKLLRKSVQYSDDKIILLWEIGRYDAQGDQLTITPASSRTEAWSKLNITDKFAGLKTRVDN